MIQKKKKNSGKRPLRVQQRWTSDPCPVQTCQHESHRKEEPVRPTDTHPCSHRAFYFQWPQRSPLCSAPPTICVKGFYCVVFLMVSLFFPSQIHLIPLCFLLSWRKVFFLFLCHFSYFTRLLLNPVFLPCPASTINSSFTLPCFSSIRCLFYMVFLVLHSSNFGFSLFRYVEMVGIFVYSCSLFPFPPGPSSSLHRSSSSHIFNLSSSLSLLLSHLLHLSHSLTASMFSLNNFQLHSTFSTNLAIFSFKVVWWLH